MGATREFPEHPHRLSAARRTSWLDGGRRCFWRTGTFNFDIQAFSHKFLSDITDAQTKDGAFTNVSPDLLRPDGSEGAPGWGDAGVILPWTVWLQYGDKQAITDNWKAMERWMDFIAKANIAQWAEKSVTMTNDCDIAPFAGQSRF